MLIGIGTDIIENKRIKEIAEKFGERFLKRVFTPAEIDCCTGRHGIKVQSLAARFAAKEAVAKALGTGLGRVNWKDIEITRDHCGAPVVHLSGAASVVAEEKGVSDIKISLSHSEEHSVAFVIMTN